MAKADPADPIARFSDWMREAARAESAHPNAATLATATADGRPSVRMVLVKAADTAGFAFYTHLESQKGRELTENPHAALCFYWKSLARQVRAEGPVERVPDGEADTYFATRPRDARIGAWASRQSRPLAGREELARAVADADARFADGPVPRPPFWSGFRLVPHMLEFWSERPARLHVRQRFSRDADGWRVEELAP